MDVFKSVLEAAGLEDEGDTLDRRLTVRLNTCLGACSQAPVMSMDHHLAGRTNPDSAAKNVAHLLEQEAHGR
jgi:NADH:ubiquinone oxidoreductase subunit E